jgi:hypothetical protein
MAAEITQIDAQSFLFQDYGVQDTSLITSVEVNTTLSTGSYVELFIYDLNQNILTSDYNFSQYTVLDNGQSAGSNNAVSQIEIDPEKVLVNSGFDQGEYITYFNFFNKQVGSQLQQLYISEISSDRTELRLDSTSLTDLDLIEQTNNFVQQRENSPYFVDFYLNFGENELTIANNIQLDNTDPTNVSILVKLYEPLPEQFSLNSPLWIVTSVDEPLAYQVIFEDLPIIITDTVNVKGPNFNLDLKDQINNSTVSLDYNTLTSTTLSSSFNQLSSLLEEKEIDINIDYTSFPNFVHFSSVQARLENFYYKVSLLEDYSSSIALIDSQITGSTSSSLVVNNSKAVYETFINDIITNFDNYEYYLYYSSGSWAWPKVNSQPPYQLYTTGSTQVLNWFGSIDETSIYYGGIILSASIYDNANPDNLYYAIPEYLRNDPSNQPYELFVSMVGQFYDNIWVYYKDVTEKYNADNRLEYGVSKDIVADAIRDFGIKLYQNNFSIQDLYTAFIGLTPEGGLFPFPNITGSLPTPSGFEYVDTLISASNDYIPLDDVNKSLYKRIYHNLPYLLKSKGTLPGLRTLITSYGIPDTVLRIKEYGGKDKVNVNDWDYWQDTFNYAFYTTGSNSIISDWKLNPNWNSPDSVPSTLAFRFKTEGLPTSSIPYSQSLWYTDTYSSIVLQYTGSGYTTGSYSGSIIDPYYQYANLVFYPDPSTHPGSSASIYLPFFDGGWWSVMVTRNGDDFNLYAGNNIYEGGDNGTLLGFYSSSFINEDSTFWILGSTSTFGSQNPSIPGGLYDAFSGSFQEIRYYNTVISESVFKDYIMNPHSIEGNFLNSSPDNLAFRASLGGELYTGSVSIHPKVTGSWTTTSSFNFNSDFIYTITPPTFNPNTEYFFVDQPLAGIKNAISDKIRVEDNTIPSGNTLSAFRTLSQNSEISQSYTANTNLLEVAFSPQDEINDDIADQIGYYNIGEFIGDPRFRSSSALSYPELDTLRNAYFEKYTKNYDLNDYIRLIKFFDNSLFKMIKDFVPARTSLASGIVIKQHLLERNRYPEPQVDNYSTIAYTTSGSQNNIPFTFQDISVTGTLAPQWNDYQPGTVQNFSGGPGGVFNPYNSILTSPYGANGTGPNNIFFLTQSWLENIPTISGSVLVLRSTQDEFYNGEFSGSNIIVTTQSLAQAYPLDISSLVYNVSGSAIQFSPFILTPPQGRINWQGSTYISSSYVSYLYINETSLDGINISTALSNLESGDTITFTVSGSVDDGPFLGQPFEATTKGTITSVIPTNSSVWRINLSTDPNFLATVYNIQYPGNFVLYPELYPSSSVYLNPFINDLSNYYYSNYNPIINNINEARLSTRFEEVSYNPAIQTPSNFAQIISGSAIKADVQDSNYSSKRVINPRYDGVKSTSQQLNVWTPGDTGTYGKTPTAEQLKTMVAYCDSVSGWPPERMNASAIHILYLIKSDGTVVIPNVSENSLYDNKGTFESGERLIISPKTVSAGSPQQYRNIIRGGTRIEPILYTQYGHSPASWNTTMSFEDITLSANSPTGNYTALYNKTTTQAIPGNGNFYTVTFPNTVSGLTAVSNGYQISSNAILDGVDIWVFATVRIACYHYTWDTNLSTTLRFAKNGVPIPNSAYNFPETVSSIPYGNTTATVFTYNIALNILNANLSVGDTYTLEIARTGIGGTTTLPGGQPSNVYNIQVAGTQFQTTQQPIATSPVTSSGFNSIWGYADKINYPNVITSSNSTLVNLYGDPNAKMANITGSGFNPVVLPWSIEYADEFRFEGREDYVYQVGKIFAPGDSGSGRITQTGSIEVHFNYNLPVSASSSVFNLDHFLIRRYIDDASLVLMKGYRPINSSGPFIVRPEYVVPELNKSVDEFILDLTQKGLIP